MGKKGKDNRGGYRTPGPGKKLGRPKLNKKKRTFALSNEAVQILDELDIIGFKKSDIVEYLIKKLAKAEFYDGGNYSRLIINLRRRDLRGRHPYFLFDEETREYFQE